MDWAKVKAAIGQVAPWLAGTLGSPVAGVAVKAVCDVFGLTAAATPEIVTAAVASATPEQLQALRTADQKHAEFMAQIGYTTLELLNADRDSARKREMEIKDRTPSMLAALAVFMFLVSVIYVAIGDAPADSMRDGFWLLVGAVIATYKDVYGYYFGSSSGSKAKDDTIQGMSK